MTTPTIVVFTDEEMSRWTAVDEEPGFGALQTEHGPLPLKALDVQARLEGLIAEVFLTQTFVNTHAEPLEATYIFPLPDRAAVTRFRLEVAGRVVEGVLKERAAARREYEQALKAGHRAAITEEERPNVFTMRVGNLPPGEAATVRLTLAGPLVYDTGEVTFHFPLVVAPRYIPGSPLPGRSVGDGTEVDTDAVPDASRISPPVLLPGYPNPVRFSFTLDLHSTGIPLQNVRSSLHAVVTEQLDAGTMRISVEPGERLTRDFILRYQLGADKVQTSLTLVPDAAAPGEGTYLVTVVPPLRSPRPPRPRDVMFVLDRSGSMGGWKMVAARRALGRMVDALTECDRFAVIAFDDQVEMLPASEGGLVAASDRQRYRAIEWLARIEARGGTEMAQPLDAAVRHLGGDRDRVLVLVTDGQVGNEDQILAMLGKRLQGIRIFTLGVDRAVNEAFLRRLAALGGGCCDVVESEDRLDEVMEKVQRRIESPLWTGLQLEANGIRVEADAQVPARLPDLFAGVPLQVMGRFRGAPEGSMVLRATDDAGRTMSHTVLGRGGRSTALAQVWARGRLRDLEDQWLVGGQDTAVELEKIITSLSLKFGVLCRFTAFVAVDRSEVINEGCRQQHVVQPIEIVEGWETHELQALAYKCSAPVAASATAGIRRGGKVLGAVPPARLDKAVFAKEDAAFAAFAEEQMPLGLPAKAKSGGVFGWLRNLCRAPEEFRKGCKGFPEELSTASLTAYRQRVREMLEEMKVDSDKTHALGVLGVKLRALIDDLNSIGAGADVMAPLAKLLVKIQSPQRPETVGQLYTEAEKTLAKFART